MFNNAISGSTRSRSGNGHDYAVMPEVSLAIAVRRQLLPASSRRDARRLRTAERCPPRQPATIASGCRARRPRRRGPSPARAPRRCERAPCSRHEPGLAGGTATHAVLYAQSRTLRRRACSSGGKSVALHNPLQGVRSAPSQAFPVAETYEVNQMTVASAPPHGLIQG
jgi:hypothetical protein